MRRFTAILLALIMLCSISAISFADNATSNEMRTNLNRKGRPGEGAAVVELELYMNTNGKIVKDLDGNVVTGKLKEAVFQAFYRVMNNVPVNWSKFDYAQFEAFVDEKGNATLGKQVMGALDGTSVSSDDAEVAVFETPNSFHAVGEGSTVLSQYDYYGNVLSSSQADVRAFSNGSLILVNACAQCGEDQGNEFHMMACGHYSCQVGEVGHGAGACGVPGHMNCDGKEHGKCSNCLKSLCSGLHGVGVCEHVHNWQFAGSWFSPSHRYWVSRVYCEGCNTFSYSATELPVVTPAPAPTATPAPAPTASPAPTTIPVPA